MFRSIIILVIILQGISACDPLPDYHFATVEEETVLASFVVKGTVSSTN